MAEGRVLKSYDVEFNLSAVWLALEKHQPVAQVAREE